MKSLALNGNIDIYAVGGQLAIASDIDAVKVGCETAMRAITGEMIYAADQGMPLFESVFNQLNIPRFQAAARLTLRKVPHVSNVQSFTTLVVDDVLTYAATIITDFVGDDGNPLGFTFNGQ